MIEERCPGNLGIWHYHANGTLVPLAQGDNTTVYVGSGGLNMIVPSLRVITNVDPRSPEYSVEVEIDGVLIASEVELPPDMESDGDGYVLRDVRVPFVEYICCFNCSRATIRAEPRDSAGRTFTGEVSGIILGRAACPDPDICCDSADLCSKPEMAQLCE